MGNILSAIRDDIEEYKELCKKYGEVVQVTPTHQGVLLPDCYGNHANLLKDRERKVLRIRQTALSKLTDEEKRALGF